MTASATTAFLVALVPSFASAQVPAGGEFQIGPLWSGAVAATPRGEFIVASGASGRRFDAAGVPLGSAFGIGVGNAQAIAVDDSGRFVVAGTGSDGSDAGIFAQVFDAAGGARGPAFRVNTYTDQYQDQAFVAADAVGNFVVVWTDWQTGDGDLAGVFGRRYDATGAPRGGEFRVNTYTTHDQSAPVVASHPAGSFVVAWESRGGDGDFTGVFAQRFDKAGERLGGEFQVNTYTRDTQDAPQIAISAAGDFVIIWESHFGQDGSWTGVYGQRFAADGERLGGEFRVNTTTVDDQHQPAVSMDAVGNFLVAWTNGDSGFRDLDVFAQRFDNRGVARGSEFRVNTYTTEWQLWPAVASDPSGNVLVTWGSRPQGLMGQRFGGITPAALAIDSLDGSGSDGNGILEAGESVDLRPAWRNESGAAWTLDASVVDFGGPAAVGVSYDLQDEIGSYGLVTNGSTATCSDCYQIQVTSGSTRPTTHWDAVLTESLTPDALGEVKRWPLHVGGSFGDVPKTSSYYPFVETLLHNGVSGGCSATSYCPANTAGREQMAVFVLVAKEGAGYTPPTCASPVFADVPASSPYCSFVEELARRGVVNGCGGGNYCPAAPVTREQMPIFVLRTLDPAVDPPPCGTPIFADVPASSPYCRFIEELARRGVVSGCGGGNYCPADPVTREQMAVFITVTFGLTLYGP